MAHFARLEDNIVQEVVVVNNAVILDSDGVEQEQLGIDFCKSLYGEDTNWIQTSYNGSFRGQYAGLGDIYDPIEDKFITPSIGE